MVALIQRGSQFSCLLHRCVPCFSKREHRRQASSERTELSGLSEDAGMSNMNLTPTK